MFWIFLQARYIRNLSYSTENHSWSLALKAKFVLSILIVFIQLGCGIIPALRNELLCWLLMGCYILIPTSGWILSIWVMALQHQTGFNKQQLSLVCFWSYYSVIQFALSASHFYSYVKYGEVELARAVLQLASFSIILVIIIINSRSKQAANEVRIPKYRRNEQLSFIDMSNLLPEGAAIRV